MGTIIQRDSAGRNAGHDLIGCRSGTLTVVRKLDRRDANGYTLWEAICDCGNTIERPTYAFVRGRKALATCGCGPKGRPRIPNQGAHVNALFTHYRRSAAERSIEFKLTKEEARAFFEGNCHYCGIPPTATYTHVNLSGVYAWNGIDRMDSASPYTPENCVSCCTRCNWAKGTMSVGEFTEWIARVYRHLFSEPG